jgi:hypothetical protein
VRRKEELSAGGRLSEAVFILLVGKSSKISGCQYYDDAFAATWMSGKPIKYRGFADNVCDFCMWWMCDRAHVWFLSEFLQSLVDIARTGLSQLRYLGLSLAFAGPHPCAALRPLAGLTLRHLWLLS